MAGLLDLFQQDPRNRQAEDSAYQLGQLNPFQQSAVREQQARQGMERGVRQAAGGLTGQDFRTQDERRMDAIEAVKADIAKLGLDANDPASMDEFYRRAVQSLQQNGLAAEALTVAKEYQAQKLARSKEERANRAQVSKDQYYKDKTDILKSSSVEGLMAAYQDLLRQSAADPSDMALKNMLRAYEAKLGVKTSGAFKIVPATKYSPGMKVNTVTGEVETLGTDKAVTGGSGAGGNTEKERTRARLLELEEKIRNGTATQAERDWVQAVYDERAGKDKPPLEGEMQMNSALAQLENVTATFQDKFGGGWRSLVPEFAQNFATAVETRIGTNVGENEWWSRYAVWKNAMLKAMSGAAVTAPEQARFNEAAPQRGMTPEVIKSRLKVQAEIARIGLEAAAEKRKAPRRVVPGASAPVGKEAAPAASAPQRKRFNPATGRVE